MPGRLDFYRVVDFDVVAQRVENAAVRFLGELNGALQTIEGNFSLNAETQRYSGEVFWDLGVLFARG